MEYAGSYALFNYRLEDPSRGLEYDNLRLIRAFEHGLDPKSSEAGFVLVHVDMVQNSGPLVDGVVSALEACENNDREAFDVGMNKVVQSMIKVNKVMDGMSNSSRLLSFYVYRRLKLTRSEGCGERVSLGITRRFEHLFLESQASLCFLMG
jgi:indoleamine 2,3-dioxygenase